MILQEDIKIITADKNIAWNKLFNAKILVTGATGLIGSLCIRTLLAIDIPLQIYALVRDIQKAKSLFGDKVNYIVGDVRNPLEDEIIVDFIIHCASNTKSKLMVDAPVDTLDIAISGTKNILNYANKCKIKSMAYLSSMEVYGITTATQNPVSEDKLGFIDLTSARSSYSEGKRAAECLCMCYYHQYKLPVKIVRLALTFGAGIPLSDNRVSMQFANSVISGKDIILHTAGKSISNFCYTTDTVRGIFTILLNGEDGQSYNVCNDNETRSISEIAELVVREIAENAIKVDYDIPQNKNFGYAPDVLLRLTSAKLNKLGWRATVNLETAYRRLIKYIKEDKSLLE
ncbi:MAG: NAD-dependent epimerase/dehydratase family protein [Salinivirgaceae bacterium]|nr:NAD-dependent epimerase/dehydratase family protein [Salinivirgaceae bacterium]